MWNTFSFSQGNFDALLSLRDGFPDQGTVLQLFNNITRALAGQWVSALSWREATESARISPCADSVQRCPHHLLGCSLEHETVAAACLCVASISHIGREPTCTTADARETPQPWHMIPKVLLLYSLFQMASSWHYVCRKEDKF